MFKIIKSLFSNSTEDYRKIVEILLSEEKDVLLSVQEKAMFKYLSSLYDTAGTFPTEEYFLQEFPEAIVPLSKENSVCLLDLKIHFQMLMKKRGRQHSSKEVMKIANEVTERGLTPEHYEKMRHLFIESDIDFAKEVEYGLDNFEEFYQKRKSQSVGLLTYIKALDEKIGGLSSGTVNTIFGWVASYKTLLGLNMAYNNSYKLGYNIAYISLEVSKQDLIFNLLSRHSYEAKFKKYPFVAHDKLRKNVVSFDEEEYVMKEVLPSLRGSKGKLILLDETDFKNFSFGEIYMKLEEIDDSLEGGLDAVFWDHANLFKFNEPGYSRLSQGDIINMYVSFIRRLSIAFRRDKVTGEYRKLCNIVMAQANREGWKRAEKAGGRYDLRAIAEANELERSSYRIISIYTNPNLQESKEATVQLLKNRSGEVIYDPVTFFVDPESYTAGDEMEGFDDMLEAEEFDSIFGKDDGIFE